MLILYHSFMSQQHVQSPVELLFSLSAQMADWPVSRPSTVIGSAVWRRREVAVCLHLKQTQCFVSHPE